MRLTLAAAFALAAALLSGPSQAAGDPPRPERAICSAFGDGGESRADLDCLDALAFTPGDYFERHGQSGDDQADVNWVSAVRDVGRPIWAFAVAFGCPDRRGADCRKSGQERLIIRVVREKPGRSMAAARPGTTPAQAARAAFDWQEADLAACPAALAVLDRLRAIDPRPIADWQWRYLQGEPPPGPPHVRISGIWVTVTQHGDGGALATGDQGDPGTAGAWALDMFVAAEPCLKPSKATPPWDLP